VALDRLLLLGLASACMVAQDWQSLFDGKSLSGWTWEPVGRPGTGVPPSWIAGGGILRTAPRRGNEVYLLSRGTYRDFELEFEWNAEARSNSGIKYRLQGFSSKGKPELTYDPDPEAPHRIEPIGLEFQITDDVGNEDALSSPRHASGALYDYVEPSGKSKPALAGTWHKGRIVARGLHIEHWIDGECVMKVNLDSAEAEASFAISKRKSASMHRKQARRESPIALQIHDGIVQFRNIRIRRL
jgi:hypothetical protein